MYLFNKLIIDKPFGDIDTIHKEACALSQQTGCSVEYTFDGVVVYVPLNTQFKYSDVECILRNVKTGQKHYC